MTFPKELHWHVSLILRWQTPCSVILKFSTHSLQVWKVPRLLNWLTIDPTHSWLLPLQVMQPVHKAEHMDIVTHVSPGHAITSTDPPYHLNLDALNFAALDLLVGFTGKVRGSLWVMFAAILMVNSFSVTIHSNWCTWTWQGRQVGSHITYIGGRSIWLRLAWYLRFNPLWSHLTFMWP